MTPVVLNSLETYGYKPDPVMVETFTKYRKTHNDGVFDAYTSDVRKCRSSHILTGLPDAYGRGRIIGDYRRVALYGIDRLVEVKKHEKASLDDNWSTRRPAPLRSSRSRHLTWRPPIGTPRRSANSTTAVTCCG